MKALASLLVVAALGAHLAHRALDRLPVPAVDPRETFASEDALRLLALGYRNLWADYYWLRSISHFGTTEMHALHYPNLEPLLRRVTALDPYFAEAYFFAGTALTVKGLDPRASVELLERGMRYRADDWRIPFLLGFNLYFFVHDYAAAARYMAEAATLPGAPEIAGPLATRLAAEAGQPEVGLHFIEAVLDTIEDEQLRATYLERRDLLLLELYLKHLNAAAEEFARRFHRPPRRLSELVEAHLVPSIPAEPLGGRFELSADGKVRTSNEARRLRLPAEARGLP